MCFFCHCFVCESIQKYFFAVVACWFWGVSETWSFLSNSQNRVFALFRWSRETLRQSHFRSRINTFFQLKFPFPSRSLPRSWKRIPNCDHWSSLKWSYVRLRAFQSNSYDEFQAVRLFSLWKNQREKNSMRNYFKGSKWIVVKMFVGCHSNLPVFLWFM